MLDAAFFQLLDKCIETAGKSIRHPESFQGIVNSAIRVEVRIACLQYQEENHGSDLVDFKQKVESELQYDV